ncbi:hypothetical protein KA005_37455 [bacterium]|nr:hypothetical protein [bacterium]
MRETWQFPPDFKATNVALTREILAKILLQPKIQDKQIGTFERIDIPYLFLAWADGDIADLSPGRIHIAYAIIPENLQDISFKHVLLPERFSPRLFSEIPIAIAQQNDLTGPMLYIAYKDDNGYGDGGGILPGYGRLVIINLDLFFQIAETGEDLWPTDTVPNLTYTPETVEVPVMPGSGATVEMQQDVLTDFKWHWPRLAYHTRSSRLSSNGKQVALLWENGGSLWIHWSYTFETKAPETTNIFVTFGACILEIPYAKYQERFLHHIQYKETEEDYWIGNVKAINGDIFYSDSCTLVVWIDPDSRLLIAKVRNTSGPTRADLLADLFTSGYSPKLAFVKDELDNRNIVMKFTNAGGVHSRILFLSGPRIPGILDFDDLPK